MTQLAPGPHEISVKKSAATWMRIVQIQAGSMITLNAPLTGKK